MEGKRKCALHDADSAMENGVLLEGYMACQNGSSGEWVRPQNQQGGDLNEGDYREWSCQEESFEQQHCAKAQGC